MRLSGEWFKEQHATVVDRQDSVGGSEGTIFDSGCNLSRLRKVHIQYGPVSHQRVDYNCAIKRIFFEFETPCHSGELRSPSYDAHYTSNCVSSERTIELDGNDSIVRIDVWTDKVLVNAIRFHLKSGGVTELYGAPRNEYKNCTSFEGVRLVGVHGCFREGINSVGFAFVSDIPYSVGSSECEEENMANNPTENASNGSEQPSTRVATIAQVDYCALISTGMEIVFVWFIARKYPKVKTYIALFEAGKLGLKMYEYILKPMCEFLKQLIQYVKIMVSQNF